MHCYSLCHRRQGNVRRHSFMRLGVMFRVSVFSSQSSRPLRGATKDENGRQRYKSLGAESDTVFSRRFRRSRRYRATLPICAICGKTAIRKIVLKGQGDTSPTTSRSLNRHAGSAHTLPAYFEAELGPILLVCRTGPASSVDLCGVTLRPVCDGMRRVLKSSKIDQDSSSNRLVKPDRSGPPGLWLGCLLCS
jgi:hypothetical protein